MALITLPLMVLSALPAEAGGGLFMSLYGDRRARQVGDTLHLVIVEHTSASVRAGQTSQRNTDTQVGPGLGRLSFMPLMGFSGTASASATGTSSRGGSMTARMTVQIVEITETGNLVVEGQRAVNVNSDRETIRIRGEVRPKDIRPDNSIHSHDLADVQIDYAGSDPRKPRRKGGLITRLLGLLF